MFVADILIKLFTDIYKHISPKITENIYCFFGIMVFLILSWITAKRLNVRLPFTVDTAFMAATFILSGRMLKNALSWLLQQKHPIADGTVFVVSMFVMRIAVKSGKASCMMYVNQYGDYLYTLLAAYGGIAAFLVIVKWLYALLRENDFGKNLILWYGRNSLATFPIHLSIKMWMWNNLPLACRSWYILFPAMLVLNIPIVNFITQYVPILLGRFPAKKKQTR